jgi:hypothetical protein
MSRIDAFGRLTSQAISHVWNWQPGDRLTLTADSGVVVTRRDPHGVVDVGGRETWLRPRLALIDSAAQRPTGFAVHHC